MTTLTLKASKVLHELGVVVERERYWIKPANEPRYVTFGPRNTFSENHGIAYPALLFSELLSALPEIGEKLGWKNIAEADATSMVYKTDSMPEWLYNAHRLTDTYLQSGMEGVSEELTKLL